MIDSAIFTQLRQKYGSHAKVAYALGISSRTYFNWRNGKLNLAEWRAAILLDTVLSEMPHPCPGTSSADPQAKPFAEPPSPLAARLVPKRDRTT